VYRVEMCAAVEVEILEATSRGDGGFGHTGR
jgi:dUTPase